MKLIFLFLLAFLAGCASELTNLNRTGGGKKFKTNNLIVDFPESHVGTVRRPIFAIKKKGATIISKDSASSIWADFQRELRHEFPSNLQSRVNFLVKTYPLSGRVTADSTKIDSFYYDHMILIIRIVGSRQVCQMCIWKHTLKIQLLDMDRSEVWSAEFITNYDMDDHKSLSEHMADKIAVNRLAEVISEKFEGAHAPEIPDFTW